MSEEFLFICEDKSQFKNFISEIKNITRRFGAVQYLALGNIEQHNFEKASIIFINHDDYSENKLKKFLDYIHKNSNESYVIFLTSDIASVQIDEFYKRGVYEFIDINARKEEIKIKLSNLYKYAALNKLNIINSIFANISEIKNTKYGFYTHRALKDAFSSLTDKQYNKNSCYMIIKLNDSNKTKIALNRLAANLKKYLRQTDIISQGIGKFYILLNNISVNDTKSVIEKISNSMGKELKIHAGISTIEYKTFEEIEKDANDSLKSAIINDKLYDSIDNKYCSDENWLNQPQNNKHYKLFEKIFKSKIETVIEPFFYEHEKKLKLTHPNIIVNQYANQAECTFSIKYGKRASKLQIEYDGYGKINIKIIHRGLETAENSTFNISLNKLDKDYLSEIFNKFNTEFAE